jgi:hypothetical protein
VTDDDFDARRFARSFEQFLEHMHTIGSEEPSAWRERATAHLGTPPDGLPSLAEVVDPTDLPNLQLALDAVLAEAPGWELVGLPSEARHYGGFSLASVLSGRMGPQLAPTAASYVNVPVDVDETLPCVELGVYFLTVDDVPLLALVAAGMEHGPRPGLTLEVISAHRDASARLLARIRTLMHERNVYRGKVLAFAFSEYGGFGITFHRVPHLTRDDVIMPEADLAAIEQHALSVSTHAEALRAAGRHLKRGLLLFGPPGTGKTLSVMYLCNEMRGRTVILLSGMGAGALGQAVAIARSLQPSMVVLEDVDLVAMERTMPGMGTNPLLFQLLNEMDGLAEDADVVFVLTTNRVELLEPALAARPGRIDQAVEIKLPDTESRLRLFELYLRGVDHAVEAAELDGLVERTEGVSAAFVRELVRRATLAAISAGRPTVTAAGLDASLTDILEHATPVLRSTLGANPGAADAFGAMGLRTFGPEMDVDGYPDLDAE